MHILHGDRRCPRLGHHPLLLDYKQSICWKGGEKFLVVNYTQVGREKELGSALKCKCRLVTTSPSSAHPMFAALLGRKRGWWSSLDFKVVSMARGQCVA